MANEVGISDTSVLRIWRAHGLKPHRSESFKVSNDPHFAEKLEAVVGLYLPKVESSYILQEIEKLQRMTILSDACPRRQAAREFI